MEAANLHFLSADSANVLEQPTRIWLPFSKRSSYISFVSINSIIAWCLIFPATIPYHAGLLRIFESSTTFDSLFLTKWDRTIFRLPTSIWTPIALFVSHATPPVVGPKLVAPSLENFYTKPDTPTVKRFWIPVNEMETRRSIFLLGSPRIISRKVAWPVSSLIHKLLWRIPANTGVSAVAWMQPGSRYNVKESQVSVQV